MSEVNRFLLDLEYLDLSEAAKVYHHVPNYDPEHLTTYMKDALTRLQPTIDSIHNAGKNSTS